MFLLLNSLWLYHLYALLSGIVDGILCSTGASVIIRNYPITAINHPDIPLLKHTLMVMIADIHNEVSPPEQVIILALPFVIPAPGESRPRGGGDQV